MKKHLLVLAMLAMAVLAFAYSSRPVYTEIVLDNPDLDIKDYVTPHWININHEDNYSDPNWYFEVSDGIETWSTDTKPVNLIKVGKFTWGIYGDPNYPIKAFAWFNAQIFSTPGPSTGKVFTLKLKYLPNTDEATNTIIRSYTQPSGVGGVQFIEGGDPNFAHGNAWVLPETILGAPPVLPVELSNFSAVLTAENFVKLSWRTQSETGMLGYRVYRGESDVQASSMMLPVLIPANNTSNVIDYTWVDSEVEVQHTYWYWLEAVEVNGTGQFYGPLTVRVEGEIPSVLPTITTMGNAYPNPFKQSSSTTIDVSIKEGENGTVTVYNILGQIVKTFKVNEGEHQINWNGKDARGNNCGSGIYFYKLSTPSTNMTKKMVIVK